ncbi:MAG TPA: hypothetical protein V6D17_21485 [Candidatus Obscuribacterales bacterium]
MSEALKSIPKLPELTLAEQDEVYRFSRGVRTSIAHNEVSAMRIFVGNDGVMESIAGMCCDDEGQERAMQWAIFKAVEFRRKLQKIGDQVVAEKLAEWLQLHGLQHHSFGQISPGCFLEFLLLVSFTLPVNNARRNRTVSAEQLQIEDFVHRTVV